MQTKPAPTLRVPDVTIASPEGEETKLTAFVDVTILDSTGKEPYRGDVLVRGQRIAKVGERLTAAELHTARVIRGDGRTLMAGLSE
jgi:imidazolonepropionase-like amidohydrolase